MPEATIAFLRDLGIAVVEALELVDRAEYDEARAEYARNAAKGREH